MRALSGTFDSATDDPEGESSCQGYVLSRSCLSCCFRFMKRDTFRPLVFSFQKSKTPRFFPAGSSFLSTRISIWGVMEIRCIIIQYTLGESSPPGPGGHKMGYFSHGLGEMIPQTGLYMQTFSPVRGIWWTVGISLFGEGVETIPWNTLVPHRPQVVPR